MSSEFSPEDYRQKGEAAYQKGLFLEAAEMYTSAASGFKEIQDDLLAAEMANNSSVAYLMAGDAARAYQAALGTDAVFAQARDYKRQGIALANQASAREAQHQTGEAITLYEAASTALKGAGEKEYRASVLKHLSALQIRSGKYLESLVSMKIALENKSQLSFREKLLLTLLRIPFRK